MFYVVLMTKWTLNHGNWKAGRSIWLCSPISIYNQCNWVPDWLDDHQGMQHEDMCLDRSTNRDCRVNKSTSTMMLGSGSFGGLGRDVGGVRGWGWSVAMSFQQLVIIILLIIFIVTYYIVLSPKTCNIQERPLFQRNSRIKNVAHYFICCISKNKLIENDYL